jgi:[ribosomal protein S5]-alanine N-acetyltransferase
MISINQQVFTAFPNLVTERFLLSAFTETEADIDALFRLKSDPEILVYFGSEPMQHRSEAQAKIVKLAEWFTTGESVQWAIRPKSAPQIVVGYFCYWNIRKEHLRAEVGYALMPEYWYQGIMQEVGTKILQFGSESLCLHSVDASIDPENAASRKVLLRLGFEKEGYFRQDYYHAGRFYDTEKFGLVF